MWLMSLIVFGVLLTAVAYLVLLERRVAAWMQDRRGPNRVGPWGLLQPLADGIKLLLKEDIIPGHVDRVPYLVAPCIALVTALMTFAVVPFGYELPIGGQPVKLVIAPGIDIGLLYIFAVSSLATYGVLLGGWSSNNKYAFLGGLRATAQILSYEVPLTLAAAGVILVSGSLRLEDIIARQAAHGWNAAVQPIAMVLFVTCVFAECNRLPFDLPECEQELVAGYHTEYSSWKFGLYFFAEYTHVITVSFLIAILFLGGWHCWGLTPASHATTLAGGLLRMGVLLAKVFLCVMFFLLIRWTIPRFRFDQVLGLAWKVLVPLAMVNFVVVLAGVYWDWPWWAHLIAGVVAIGGAIAAAARLSALPPAGEPALVIR